MKSSFRPALREDLSAIREFLAGAFGTNVDAPMIVPAVLEWKYWSPRGDWPDPRAYLLERDGAITAFAGLWPVTFHAGSEAVRGVHMIDWASSKDAPGAGLALVQKLASIFDFILAIGGSDMTQTILPAFGFKECATQWEAARPLRPLRQALSHQRRGWKVLPRLLRNSMLALRAPVSTGTWNACEIAPESINVETAACFMPRPAGFFEFLLRSPAAPFRLYGIQDENGPRGHFVISLVRGQARIAALWLNDSGFPDPESFRRAYALARKTATQIPGANEVIAIGTGAATRSSIAHAGFRVLDGPPVYLLNRKGKLHLPAEFQFQLCDDDHAFLDTGVPDYKT